MKEFTHEDLQQFNGKDGHSVYIAHQGKVYDVTNSKLWRGGLHMKRHHAGNDLTTDIKGAPHDVDVLERYPQIGVLKKKETPERIIPKPIQWLITTFPMLRRHPHPMTVHFPIVFTMAVPIFNILYLIFCYKPFEITALHCLGAAILFTPVAITTGLYTWWLNYMAKPVRAVIIKRRLSFLMFTIQLIVFVWRLMVPDILITWNATSILYFLLVLSLLPIIIIIGWFGASLTFPIEKD